MSRHGVISRLEDAIDDAVTQQATTQSPYDAEFWRGMEIAFRQALQITRENPE